MDTVTIIAITVGLILGIVHVFIDTGIGKLIDRAFEILGLQWGKGPLRAQANWHGSHLMISLVNGGKHAMRLAGLQGRNGDDKPIFPVPGIGKRLPVGDDKDGAFRELARLQIEAGESVELFLGRTDLLDLDCRRLVIVDSNARIWPVSGYVLGNAND